MSLFLLQRSCTSDLTWDLRPQGNLEQHPKTLHTHRQHLGTTAADSQQGGAPRLLLILLLRLTALPAPFSKGLRVASTLGTWLTSRAV